MTFFVLKAVPPTLHKHAVIINQYGIPSIMPPRLTVKQMTTVVKMRFQGYTQVQIGCHLKKTWPDIVRKSFNKLQKSRQNMNSLYSVIAKTSQKVPKDFVRVIN